MHQIHSHLLRY
uniref:Uncharacterized protein n=1 Tax=Medicago truncatula TaxID=3880 RepID=B7FGA1_MEDTR|nr:unknown [Medicago truncatula]